VPADQTDRSVARPVSPRKGEGRARIRALPMRTAGTEYGAAQVRYDVAATSQARPVARSRPRSRARGAPSRSAVEPADSSKIANEPLTACQRQRRLQASRVPRPRWGCRFVAHGGVTSAPCGRSRRSRSRSVGHSTLSDALVAPSSSGRSSCPTLTGRPRSASYLGTRRRGRSPSSRSTPRRTGSSGRCT